MHDATMSINTQDEILVHRRLLLPLFLLLSVFQSSLTVNRYPLFPWVKQDSGWIIESQSTAIFTLVQTHMYLQTFKETRGLSGPVYMEVGDPR